MHKKKQTANLSQILLIFSDLFSSFCPVGDEFLYQTPKGFGMVFVFDVA
jgi:hypothetical protein